MKIKLRRKNVCYIYKYNNFAKNGNEKEKKYFINWK